MALEDMPGVWTETLFRGGSTFGKDKILGWPLQLEMLAIDLDHEIEPGRVTRRQNKEPIVACRQVGQEPGKRIVAIADREVVHQTAKELGKDHRGLEYRLGILEDEPNIGHIGGPQALIL